MRKDIVQSFPPPRREKRAPVVSKVLTIQFTKMALNYLELLYRLSESMPFKGSIIFRGFDVFCIAQFNFKVHFSCSECKMATPWGLALQVRPRRSDSDEEEGKIELHLSVLVRTPPGKRPSGTESNGIFG